MLVNLRPSSIGDHDDYTLVAGASKPVACDPGAYPESHDDTTSYIRSSATTGAYSQSFVVGNKPAIGYVNGVKLGARIASTFTPATDTVSMYARFSSTDGAAITNNTGGGTWTTVGPSSVGRPGGGTWTKADILLSSLQVKIAYSNPGSDQSSCSSLWLQLDYNPLPGGYIAVAGGLIGAALGLHEMARLACEIFLRTGIKIQRSEFLEAWREMRYDPRRRIFV